MHLNEKKLNKTLIFLAIYLFPLVIFANNDYVERIRQLNNLTKKQQLDSIRVILYDLNQGSKETELKYTAQLLKMSDQLEGLGYFIVLRHYSRIAPANNLELMDSCFMYARKYHLETYFSSLYVMKAIYFKNHGQYDSAMIYTLKARDDAYDDNNIEQQANSLDLLGDLYYSAGLYPNAVKFYLQAQQIKGNEDSWNSWRQRMLLNNLALIDNKTGKYEHAITLLHQSLYETGLGLTRKFDSISVAYIQNETGVSYYGLNDTTKAIAYVDSAYTLIKDFRDSKELFKVLLMKARLAIWLNDIAGAWQFVEMADEMFKTVLPDLSDKNELLLLKSKLYEREGKIHEAYACYKRYTAANDSLISHQKSAQLIQLKAEIEYENLKSQLGFLRTQRVLFILLIIAGMLITLVIVYDYRRIKRKNRYLVSFTMESVTGKSAGLKPAIDKMESRENTSAAVDDYRYEQELINKLNKLMAEQKLYLQTNINLQRVAEEIGTNRTYLSKAINSELGFNFNAYINNLRVKEVIHIISENSRSALNISDLFNSAGFGNRGTFIESFKKYTGVTPSVFIENYRQIVSGKLSQEKKSS